MTEVSILYLFLGVAFIFAPIMTKIFFLNASVLYSRTHSAALVVLIIGWALGINWLAVVWPLFCFFGFFLYIKQEGLQIFSATGLASCIPFAFSLISATWFFAGANDLYLLGYGKTWSFYAALHGGVLGWFFLGCLSYLSTHSEMIRARAYLFSCYLCLLLFLSIAFGIDGVPHIKRIGVIGLSILVPLSIGLFLFDGKKRTPGSFFFGVISFSSIAVSMSIAVLNEFWIGFTKLILGMPLMTLTHGLINVLFTIPCFYLSIRLSKQSSKSNLD